MTEILLILCYGAVLGVLIVLPTILVLNVLEKMAIQLDKLTREVEMYKTKKGCEQCFGSINEVMEDYVVFHLYGGKPNVFTHRGNCAGRYQTRNFKNIEWSEIVEHQNGNEQLKNRPDRGW